LVALLPTIAVTLFGFVVVTLTLITLFYLLLLPHVVDLFTLLLRCYGCFVVHGCLPLLFDFTFVTFTLFVGTHLLLLYLHYVRCCCVVVRLLIYLLLFCCCCCSRLFTLLHLLLLYYIVVVVTLIVALLLLLLLRSVVVFCCYVLLRLRLRLLLRFVAVCWFDVCCLYVTLFIVAVGCVVYICYVVVVALYIRC